MAWLFADSFDFYNSNVSSFMTDAGTHWDSTGTLQSVISGSSTRFSSGQAVRFTTTLQPATFAKSSGSNDAGHHLVFSYLNGFVTAAGNGLTFTLMDGTTAQCSVVFDPSGPIYLKSGLGTGTILATFSSPGFSAGVWYGIELEVVINNTTGSFKVRINGNTSDDFSATGLNTRGGTANNYANKIQIGPTASVASVNQQLDDFLWFSTSGASPNTWVGDIRAQQLMPTSDASVALTNSNASYLQNPTSTNAMTVAAGTTNFAIAVTPTYSGSIGSLTMIFNAAYTGRYKLALYSSTGSGGSPVSLIGQTAEQINAVTGTATVALITPVVVAAGTYIHVAAIFDTVSSAPSRNLNSGYSLAGTYAAGFPASGTAAGLTGGTSASAGFVMTPYNSSQVTQATEDGDTSFVYGNTASVGDLYNVASLGVTPSSIVAVQTRMLARKSDTGTRQARIQIKSGATTSNGSTVTLGTSYSYAGAKVDTVDPNTSAAWTGTAVNSLQIGPYVVA